MIAGSRTLQGAGNALKRSLMKPSAFHGLVAAPASTSAAAHNSAARVAVAASAASASACPQPSMPRLAPRRRFTTASAAAVEAAPSLKENPLMAVRRSPLSTRPIDAGFHPLAEPLASQPQACMELSANHP